MTKRKAALRGAWDMSLPGMVVNTGLAAKQALSDRAAPVPPEAKVSAKVHAFHTANQAFSAMQQVGPKTRHVWDDKARAIALEVRRAKALTKAE